MTHSSKRDQQGGTPREVPFERHQQGHEVKDRQHQAHQDQSRQHQANQDHAGQNEGEGNRTAARAYNRHVQQTAENPSEVKRQAESARRAAEGQEQAELSRAEARGRKPARH